MWASDSDWKSSDRIQITPQGQIPASMPMEDKMMYKHNNKRANCLMYIQT